MKIRQLLLPVLSAIILNACTAPKEPPPELTYTGENPRVQEPLSAEDSRKHIQLPDGFEAVLFASEPDIINPIAFTWDERGRLWVVQSMDYPHGLDNEVGGDRITICEDTDGDGKADSFIDFAVEQSLTTGITKVKGGILVAQAPNIVFLKDTDGDDKMDDSEILFGGFGGWDTHAGPANLKWGHDNNLWGSVGYSGFENEFNGKSISFSMGVFRFSRDGKSFEPVGKFNNNTWGLGFTQNFEVFGSTANNNHVCYVGIPLRYYDYLNKRPKWAINSDFIQGHYEISPVGEIPLQQVDVRGGYTAAAGANFYTAENYPEKYWNQMYVNEPTGHLVHLAKISEEGAGYTESDGGNLFASTDTWTSPVFSETGPDGNLWVADWYNPVIQHNPDSRGMDNQIWNDDAGEGNAHKNSLRDKRHGRIYVLVHEDGKKSAISELDPDDDDKLIEGIQSPNMFWRITAQRLIVENNLSRLSDPLAEIVRNENDSYSAIHALYTLDKLGAMKNDLLDLSLESNSEGVIRAAISLLPESEEGVNSLLASNLLSSDALPIRLAALLRASDLPETEELSSTMEQLRADIENNDDKWLKAALNIYYRVQNTEDIRANEVDMVIPSVQEEVTEWRYTISDPGSEWTSESFDDSQWQTGKGTFGTADLTPQVRTVWDTTDIWLRKTVNLRSGVEEPVLKILHDERYEVYVNGQLLYSEPGYSPNYKYVRLDPELNSLFKAGENTIAVHCYNGYGAQNIDVGIGTVGEFKADRKISLNTVSQKMAYEKTTLYATAGQNVEIVLTNVDQMPHNMVVIDQGSLDAFGKLVDAFLEDPNAAELEYVPKSRYVLAYTEMLDPGEVGVIRFKAPDKPGEYPFVCTFPGHWRLMQGVLIVSPVGTVLSESPAAKNIAIMGGGGSHNFREYFGKVDGGIMSQDASINVRYTEIEKELQSYLADADILMISNNKPFSQDTREMIFDRASKGMALMINHPGTWYNWEDWPEYNKELVGGGSRSHEKLQEFEVRVTKPNHPLMQGVPRSFRIIDELYRWEADPAGSSIEVLAVGRGLESGEEFPVVWVVKHPKTKIVGNTLGHDGDAHGLKPYQTIIENTAKWLLK